MAIFSADIAIDPYSPFDPNSAKVYFVLKEFRRNGLGSQVAEINHYIPV